MEELICKNIQQSFESEAITFKKVQEHCLLVKKEVASLSLQFHLIHSMKRKMFLTTVYPKIHIIEKIVPLLKTLNNIVPETLYYSYHNVISKHIWKNLLFLFQLEEWFVNGKLLFKDNIEKHLDLAGCPNILITIEDYLSSVCCLYTELSQYAVSLVIMKDYDSVREIYNFLLSVYDNGLKLINYKNSRLRRQFDGCKYSLKKVKDIIYDLTVRGFIK